MAEAEIDQAALPGGQRAPRERPDHAGPGAPRDVEARHGVPVPDRAVAAALGPADHGEKAHALLLQPGALLARGEVHVGLGPPARPLVLGAVERRRPEPVLERELVRVLDAQPALLGGVDEKEPAEGPEGLAAERRLGLLLDKRDPPAGGCQLGGRDQPGQPAADDDGVVFVTHSARQANGEGAADAERGVRPPRAARASRSRPARGCRSSRRRRPRASVRRWRPRPCRPARPRRRAPPRDRRGSRPTGGRP